MLYDTQLLSAAIIILFPFILQNVTAYAEILTGPVLGYAFSPRGSDSNWFGFHKLTGDSFVAYISVCAVGAWLVGGMGFVAYFTWRGGRL